MSRRGRGGGGGRNYITKPRDNPVGSGDHNGIRGEFFKETYYAQHNTPTFNQFVGKYHFIDDANTQYMIANKNNQVFQNENAQRSTSSSRGKASLSKQVCIRNGLGYIKLFVKLPRGEVQHKWFTLNDIGKTFRLKYKRVKGALTPNIDKMVYDVKLKSTSKIGYSRATGIIYVKGLDYDTCNELLNK